MTAPTTVWQQVALDIAKKIQAGEAPVGAKISSYRTLTGEYRTSLGTVKRAVEYLQERGIVKGVQGSGLYVVRTPDENDLAFTPSPSPDTADRIERVEDTVERLEEGQREVRERLGFLQTALRDLYARTGHRYPGGDGRADSPRRPPRKTADG